MMARSDRKQMIAILFIAMLGGSEAIGVHRRVMLHTSLMLLFGHFGSVDGIRDKAAESAQDAMEVKEVHRWYTTCDQDFTVDVYDHANTHLKQVRVHAGLYQKGYMVFKSLQKDDETCVKSYTLVCEANAAVLKEAGSCSQGPLHEATHSFYWWYTVYFKQAVSEPEFSYALRDVMEESNVKMEEVGSIMFRPRPSTCDQSLAEATEAMTQVQRLTDNICVHGECENSSLPVFDFTRSVISFGRSIGDMKAKQCELRGSDSNPDVLRQKLIDVARNKYVEAHEEDFKKTAGDGWDAAMDKIHELERGCSDGDCIPSQDAIEDLILTLWDGPDAKIDDETRAKLNSAVQKFKSMDLAGAGSNSSEGEAASKVMECLENAQSCQAQIDAANLSEHVGALLQLGAEGAQPDILFTMGALAAAVNVVFFGAAILIALAFFPVAFFIVLAAIAAVFSVIWVSASQKKVRIARSRRR
eukprot:gb/GFBE01051549.1/.p1 GENE.gb/GFBE01051549.1/~~gb/GFBE01051549.1/.p1  ORF type:complete len:471 (+),score=98.90 gb/GFBE01051549.1/:1-1413(+)